MRFLIASISWSGALAFTGSGGLHRGSSTSRSNLLKVNFGVAHAEDEKAFTVPWRPRPPPVGVEGEEDAHWQTSCCAKHSVVFMRHGESLFNKHNVFTGWCDVPLTTAGREEARAAGHVLASHNLEFDVVFTSVLQRCTSTAYAALESCGQSYVDVRPRWELNERHYGALQGLSKSRVAETTPAETLDGWRQGYHARPPPMSNDHPHWRLIAEDRRYRHLATTPVSSKRKHGHDDEALRRLPRTESIADTAVRVMDLWEREIAPLVRQGKRVLVVSHRNSLRALIRNLEGLDDAEVAAMKIPTARPFLYPLEDDLRPVAPPIECVPRSEGGAIVGLDEDMQRRRTRRSHRLVADSSMPDSSISLGLPTEVPVVEQEGCGFQGIFLTENECTDSFRAKRKACVEKWDLDPANPPPECLAQPSEECDLSAYTVGSL